MRPYRNITEARLSRPLITNVYATYFLRSKTDTLLPTGLKIQLTILIENNTTCLDTWQPGTVYKKQDTQQSEILTNFLEIACLIPLRT